MSILTFHLGFPNRFAKNMEIKNKANSMPFIRYYDCFSSFSRLFLRCIFSAPITLAGYIRIQISYQIVLCWCERDNPVDNCEIINKNHWMISIKPKYNLLLSFFVMSYASNLWVNINLLEWFNILTQNSTTETKKGKWKNTKS